MCSVLLQIYVSGYIPPDCSSSEHDEASLSSYSDATSLSDENEDGSEDSSSSFAIISSVNSSGQSSHEIVSLSSEVWAESAEEMNCSSGYLGAGTCSDHGLCHPTEVRFQLHLRIHIIGILFVDVT